MEQLTLDVEGKPALQSILRGIDTSLRELREEFYDYRRDNNAHISRLEEEMSGLKREVVDLKISAGVTEHRLNEFRDDIKELRHEVSGLHQEVNGLKQEVSGLRQEVGGLHQKVDGLQQEVNGLHQEMNGIRQEVNGLRGDLREMAGNIGAMQTRFFMVACHSRRSYSCDAILEGVIAKCNINDFHWEHYGQTDIYSGTMMLHARHSSLTRAEILRTLETSWPKMK